MRRPVPWASRNPSLYPKIQLSASVGQQSLKRTSYLIRRARVEPGSSGLTAPIFGRRHATRREARGDRSHARERCQLRADSPEAFAKWPICSKPWTTTLSSSMATSSGTAGAQSSLDLARASYKEGNAGVSWSWTPSARTSRRARVRRRWTALS